MDEEELDDSMQVGLKDLGTFMIHGIKCMIQSHRVSSAVSALIVW